MVRKIVLLLVVILSAGLVMAEGVVIYKVTGPDGKVSYTDHPPARVSGYRIDVLVMPAGPDESEAAAARERVKAELEASRKITDRMAADRREREEARRQAAREREERAYREAWLSAQANAQAAPPDDWLWPVYGYGGHRPGRPGYPGYPAKPRPRPYTPPASSGTGGMSMSDLINRSRPW